MRLLIQFKNTFKSRANYSDSSHRHRFASINGFSRKISIKTGSATGAAKLLGLTQPGISRLIAQLESKVGFSLFYHLSRKTPSFRSGI
ncbi:LysR family transcriptional regulator [Pseudoalteromonas sp. 5-MNA-CIBAN-0065]|uniref:helix-turn-helix domain-containing protein n=1 Tax=Pseudoalteromonas sp. 5-MNA-CIBAN-0065 TaxID=3140421 RepID=UPI00331BA55E